MMIDAHFAEFVDDDGDTAPVVGRKNSIEQCCLARAKKAGKNGHGNSMVVVF